jgi:hypothetical protein
MRIEMKTENETPKDEHVTKAEYRKPHLTEYGSVNELTRGATGPAADHPTTTKQP